MMSSSRQDYFEQSASNWDSEPRRIELARSVGEAILREACPTRDMDLLDYGCGTGLVGLFLRPYVRSVTGADSSPAMLDVLSAKIRERGIPGMTTLGLDLDNQPPHASRFHLIVSSMVMHHVANPARVLASLHQMLHPGGIACIADLDAEPGDFHPPEAAATVHHHGFDRQAFQASLERAGFTAVRSTTAAIVQKPFDSGRLRDFPVFLFVARP